MGHAQLVEQFDTVVAVMDVNEARQSVDRINAQLNGASVELLRLYEGRGWQALGYTSWSECAAVEFGDSKGRMYQLLNAAFVERELSTMVDNSIPERQLRPLTAFVSLPRGPGSDQRPVEVDGDAIRESYQRAVETAPNGKVTAAHVAAVVKEMTQPTDWWADDAEADDVVIEPASESAPVAPMAVHFSSASPEWYTPDLIISRVLKVFGTIDLDPCSNAKGQAANVPAREHYTVADNGLLQPWWGKVYMNPPYGDEVSGWVVRLLDQYKNGTIDAAIALLPARVDTRWFEPLWDFPCCFVRGRLKFSSHENSAPFPSVVIYMGLDSAAFGAAFQDIGRCGLLHMPTTV